MLWKGRAIAHILALAKSEPWLRARLMPPGYDPDGSWALNLLDVAKASVRRDEDIPSRSLPNNS